MAFWVWLKEFISSPLLRQFLISAILSIFGPIGGFIGWVVNFIAGKLIDWGVLKSKEAIDHEEAKVDAGDKETKYDEIADNPNSSADDIKHAGTDFNR